MFYALRISITLHFQIKLKNEFTNQRIGKGAQIRKIHLLSVTINLTKVKLQNDRSSIR